MIYYPLILILLFVGPALASIAILRTVRSAKLSLSMRWHLVLLRLCILYGTAPLLLAWGGISLADHFACQAEVIVYHCPFPSWLGGILSGMVFAHWLAIFTIPSAILGSIGLIISLVLKVNPSPTKANISGTPTPPFYRSRRHKVIAGLCATAEHSPAITNSRSTDCHSCFSSDHTWTYFVAIPFVLVGVTT